MIAVPPSRYGSPTPLVLEGDAEALIAERVDGRAIVVTDAGVAATGWPDRLAARLGAAVWAGAASDPTESDVDLAARALRGHDVLVAVGGGSVIDTAKAASMLLANGGRMRDWRGYGVAEHRGPVVVAVPTTGGTGSEVQSFALVSRDDDAAKLACGSPHVMPRVALLDPRLSTSSPIAVTASAGVDALVHALEAAVTTVRTPASVEVAVEAFGSMWHALPAVLAAPDDLGARGHALRAACLAGAAIEASMLGAAHATANPLSAHHGLSHGVAVGRMIASVIRANTADPAAAATYGRLARAASIGDDAAALADAVAHRVRRVLPGAWPPPGLDPDRMATEAAGQWTLAFNPVALDPDALAGLYRAASTP